MESHIHILPLDFVGERHPHCPGGAGRRAAVCGVDRAEDNRGSGSELAVLVLLRDAPLVQGLVEPRPKEEARLRAFAMRPARGASCASGVAGLVVWVRGDVSKGCALALEATHVGAELAFACRLWSGLGRIGDASALSYVDAPKWLDVLAWLNRWPHHREVQGYDPGIPPVGIRTMAIGAHALRAPRIQNRCVWRGRPALWPAGPSVRTDFMPRSDSQNVSIQEAEGHTEFPVVALPKRGTPQDDNLHVQIWMYLCRMLSVAR